MESGGEMRGDDRGGGISKLKTEIEGFDLIANGGLPRGRSTLVSGTSGSAKTVFAAQFLAAGIRPGQRGGRLRDVRGIPRRHPPEYAWFRLGHPGMGTARASGRSLMRLQSRRSHLWSRVVST